MKKSKEIIEEHKWQLSYISVRDQLTGLYNKRHLEDVLNVEFERSKRYNEDLSCLMFDHDFFKEVNDSYGHQFGDFVLKELGKNVKKIIRGYDLIFRYGGEGFLILLPQTDILVAKVTAEKFRAYM